MAKRNDIDKAIRNIRNWADRPEWAIELAAVFDAHLAPVCELVDISPDELQQKIADLDYGGMLFGVVFEDLLSRRLSPGDRNIVDDYLQRRGWRESVAGRRYLQQLRDSVLNLYEVVAVSRGKYCDLIDLVRDGKTIRVYEHLGTQNLIKWDRIAARVLNTNGKHTFSGGILPFPRDAAQTLLDVLTKSRKQFLQEACPDFTSIWLAHVLRRLQAPLPEMVNRDGALTLVTNSVDRAERGTHELQALLGNVVSPPMSLLQTPEQLLANQARDDGGDKRERLNDIDPEIEAEILQKTLDAHYRRCLDESIPALGNKTPRQCSRSKQGRQKLIEWLKHLENNELRRAARAGQKPYDSSWMWDELKLT